jgi:hypothetical protein
MLIYPYTRLMLLEAARAASLQPCSHVPADNGSPFETVWALAKGAMR